MNMQCCFLVSCVTILHVHTVSRKLLEANIFQHLTILSQHCQQPFCWSTNRCLGLKTVDENEGLQL